MFDQAVSAREGKAERSMRDALAERGKAGEDRQALLDELLAIIADPAVADEDVGGLIRGERIGWPRIRAALAQAVPRLPRDHGHLGALDASSYGYLRQFTPQVLAAVEFAGGTAAAELLAAVEILRAAQHLRRPPGPRRRHGGVRTDAVARLPRRRAHASGNTSAYRHFWELCVLLGLRDGLRTGDVWVPGSRRYCRPGRLPAHHRGVVDPPGRRSAGSSASPPTRRSRWPRSPTSWPARSASSSRSWPPATARSGSTTPASW